MKTVQKVIFVMYINKIKKIIFICYKLFECFVVLGGEINLKKNVIRSQNQ